MREIKGIKDRTSLEWYANKILPESQVRKFRVRQDLLAQELENEARFPEVKNVLSDIFIAVREKDYKKFLYAHRQLAGRIDEETIFQSIRYSIVSKTSPLTKREAEVLEKINSGKGLMEVF